MSRVARSVCPVCLQPIPAAHVTEGDDVLLVKECPDHGLFRTIVWRGAPHFHRWNRSKIPSSPKRSRTSIEGGCPLDCGLCDAHRQHTCTAILEVTWRCDLGCPVCFASSGGVVPGDPSEQEISELFDRVHEASGFCNIQISGGEPTVRDDLASLVRLGKDKGFPFIQLNTNGIRLGSEQGYAAKLAEAGLDSVFLQFDGTADAIHERLRGRSLLDIKMRAISALSKAGIGVVLVPTVVPGVNDHDLGNILQFAIDTVPGVRGVHFQPVSYFGRYPESPADEHRITLPEIMRGLEVQTGGVVRADDFQPPGCEPSHCSFHANYRVGEDGALRCLTAGGDCGCSPRPAQEGADKAKAFVHRHWAGTGKPLPVGNKRKDDLDRFIQKASRTLAVSAMAFQDCWTLDLERLKGCCIHVVAPDGRLIPFCAYNLSSMGGETLYRGICHDIPGA